MDVSFVMSCITSLSITLLISFFSFSFSVKALTGETIISANDLIYESFNQWVKITPCEKISNFNSPYANRGTIELVIICQALDVAGYKTTLKLQKYPNYKRALIQAKYGVVNMPAETLWESDIDEDYFYKTSPIIKNGEFEKGIYTLPTNKKVLDVFFMNDLMALTAVIPQIWTVDWQTLQSMNIKVSSASNKLNLFKVLQKKHADFTLLEFSSVDDMSSEFGGIKLIPVPYIKVALNGSRSFVVSKNAPNAEALYKALNQGINQLRKKGVITKALEESGFINERVKYWKKLL